MSSAFKQRAAAALADPVLHTAIARTTGTGEAKRSLAVGAFPDFEAARSRAAAIKDHGIADLAAYLEMFEANAIAAGAKVHWAETSQEACDIVIDICKAVGARGRAAPKKMLGDGIRQPPARVVAGNARL
ncbi:MAG: (Fe-S)-binding protein, partial [Sphingomonas sp.]